MPEVVKFPVRAADPDELISLRAWARRGSAPVTSLRAILKWSPGFDPHSAAAACLLAANYEMAVNFWRDHLGAFRRAMHAMGLDPKAIEIIVSEYTAATRKEVRVLRDARMPRDAWIAESFATFDTAVHL